MNQLTRICAWCHPGYKPAPGQQVTHTICHEHAIEKLIEASQAHDFSGPQTPAIPAIEKGNAKHEEVSR